MTRSLTCKTRLTGLLLSTSGLACFGAAAATPAETGIYAADDTPSTNYKDYVWLQGQASACGSVTGISNNTSACVFTQTNDDTQGSSFVVNGVTLGLHWANWMPCLLPLGTTGSTTCTDALSNSVTVTGTTLPLVKLYNSDGSMAGSLSLTAGVQTSAAERYLSYINTIEAARAKVISGQGSLKLSVILVAGDLRVKCSPNCLPNTSGVLPESTGVAVTGYTDYNTPKWVMDTIANHNASAGGVIDASVNNGFIYTTDGGAQNCYMTPAPWGDIYNQLQIFSFENYLTYLSKRHKVDVVKLGGLNGHTLELTVSGWGMKYLSGCTTSAVSNNVTYAADAGSAAWLGLESYTTAKVEKAFQSYVNAITTFVSVTNKANPNLGPNVAYGFLLVSGNNIPPIDQNGNLLKGAYSAWPAEFTGQLVFDLFGIVNQSNGVTNVAATNLLSNTLIAPFQPTVSAVIPSTLSLTQFGVQTDGLINNTACYSNSSTSTCSGTNSGGSQIPENIAPSNSSISGAPYAGTAFYDLLNCELNNIAPNNIVSQNTAYATQSALTGPQNGGSGLALGFQGTPNLVSQTLTMLNAVDTEAALQTAQLAGIFGSGFVEVWGNSLSAVTLDNTATSSLGTLTVALSQGNANGCLAGSSTNLLPPG